MKRRKFMTGLNKQIWIGAALILIAVFISSCGPSQAELDAQSTEIASIIFTTQTAKAPTATLTPTPTSTPTITPTVEFVCDDVIGCVTYAPDEPIRIASALVISGPNTDLGLDSQYGVEIAIAFQGELLGHKVELQAEDDSCSPYGGQTAGQKIVSDPSIIAVIGTSCSGAGVPMSEVISEAGYVMVSPSNTAPALTDPDVAWNDGYLRTAHNDEVQGWAMARFAIEELGVTKAAAIHDGDPYTESLAKVFADSFTQMGGQIIEFTAVNKGDTNMRPVLGAVAAAGPPELIYYPVFTAEGGFLTKQAKEVSGLEDTILAAADGMLSYAAIEAVGEAGEGMYFSGPNLSFSGETYNKFIEKYVADYGSQPISVFHAHAFDATNMIFACVEEVAFVENNGTVHVGRQALRSCLYATKGFEGITGWLTCNQYGDCADPQILVYQLQGGEYVKIWP
jgi:branched-chain amino acid transport system substrate-binding protein